VNDRVVMGVFSRRCARCLVPSPVLGEGRGECMISVTNSGCGVPKVVVRNLHTYFGHPLSLREVGRACPPARGESALTYSARNALIGSTRVARLAGT
jgi:hypothetical protein